MRPDHRAVFSPDGRYRYTLYRFLSVLDMDRQCVFVMLNPSTADDEVNDPTVRRCVGFARAWGFGSLRVLNLFALRSTDPAALYTADDPVGPENDAYIESLCRRSDWGGRELLVVCAWGNHGQLQGRGEAVRRLLLDVGADPHILEMTSVGQPRHPLYLPKILEPRPWT